MVSVRFCKDGHCPQIRLERGGAILPNHAKPVKLIVAGPTEAFKADSAFENVIKS